MAEQTTSSGPGTADETEQPESGNQPQVGTKESARVGLAGTVLLDIAALFAALSIWGAADTWHAVSGLWIAQVVAVGDAVLIGLLLAALAHEWGHYVGARAAGAAVAVKRGRGLSLLRFEFNYAENDTRQFHWMTYGGHIAHWTLLIILLIALPLDTLSPISLVSAMFAFIVFASVIEYGIVRDTRAGEDPEARVKALTPDDFKRSMAIGALGGLFALAGLA